MPDGTPIGSCTIQVAGASLPLAITGTSLARTGSDIGPAIGIGAALIALGAAAAYGARRRTQQAG